MSLDALDTRITNDRDKAQQLMQSASDSYNRIRANDSLSADGKRSEIAKVFLALKPKVDALKADEVQAISDTRDSLTRALFGTSNTDPSNLIAYRDAQDRASRLDNPNTALTLMNRALLNHDTTLVAAVLEQALSLNWTEVIVACGAAYPDQATRLADLQTVQRLISSQNGLGPFFFIYHVVTPDELAGVSTDMLERLATAGAWQ